MEKKLVACPVCNKAPKKVDQHWGGTTYFVRCPTIDCIRGPIRKTEAAAAKRWDLLGRNV